MAEETKIEWCDATFNPWIGCTKVAAGCTHCYAEAFTKRTGKAKWGDKGTRVKTSGPYWDQPHKWNDQAARDGVRRRVFCASLADVFEDWTGEVLSHRGTPIKIEPSGIWTDDATRDGRLATFDDLRSDLFALIDETPNLDWLLLTKRPENIRRFWPVEPLTDEPGDGLRHRNNVWLLASIACQDDANRNVPLLLKCRDLAPVLGLSYEPAVGPVRFDGLGLPIYDQADLADGQRHEWRLHGGSGPWIDWLIVGGESGPGARPCELAWIRSAVAQCRAAGVSVLVKQLGAHVICDGCSAPGQHWPHETKRLDTGLGNFRVMLKDKKGGDSDEWPEDLRVREYPTRKERP